MKRIQGTGILKVEVKTFIKREEKSEEGQEDGKRCKKNGESDIKDTSLEVWNVIYEK